VSKLSGPFRTWRRVRSRWSRWSAGSDREFHDRLFGTARHDPFSRAYPGNITIKRFADLAADRLDAARVVLDLGCGPGEITCELAARFPGVRFHGVDHSQTAVDRASSHANRLQLANVTFQRADLQTFVPDGPADLVVMFDAFHHLTAPAAFVKHMSRFCERFLLIEPAGDALGRWKRTIDFDWLPAELEKIRARIEYVLRESASSSQLPAASSQLPACSSQLPASSSASSPSPEGRAVEHRYPIADYESFFAGFHLSIRGTVAGLDVYPPQPGYDSPWRRSLMDTAYGLLKQVDDRLMERHLDLHAKHWAIYADRSRNAAEGRSADRAQPAGMWEADVVRGPHDIRFEAAEIPPAMPAAVELTVDVTIRNESWRTLKSDGVAHPIFVSYRWLDRQRRPVVREGRRSPLPRPLEPGASCQVALRLQAPSIAGDYILELDLVEEGVTWFSEVGVPSMRVAVRVTRG
jgi:SAM-dependent methyltransferase